MNKKQTRFHFTFFVTGNSVKLLGQKKENNKKIGGAKLSLPKIRRNPLIEIISINTGFVLNKNKIVNLQYILKCKYKEITRLFKKKA